MENAGKCTKFFGLLDQNAEQILNVITHISERYNCVSYTNNKSTVQPAKAKNMEKTLRSGHLITNVALLMWTEKHAIVYSSNMLMTCSASAVHYSCNTQSHQH